MGMWDLIALAVVCGCLLAGYKVYTKSKRASGDGARELERLEERIATLEKRVEHDLESRTRTLEAIVTDSKHQLSQEIESLQ